MNFEIIVKDPKNSSFSLKKEDADFSYNQLVLNSLVGTLVKYGQSGKIEPYLAYEWTQSSDGKNWKFKIRKNLFTEDNKIIDAKLIYEILLKSLKEITKDSSAISFDHLLGWNEFKAGANTIAGLSYNEDEIIFSFDSNVGDLLELLRMPMFGLWIEKDGKLISSGPYRLGNFSSNKLELILRDNWFTVSSSSFKKVTVAFSAQDNIGIKTDGPKIVRVPFYVEESSKFEKDYYWIISPPTRFEGFVLSPTKNNFFNKKTNRIKFASKVSELFPSIVKSQFVFQSAHSKLNRANTNYDYDLTEYKAPITFALERLNYSDQEISDIKHIISYAFDKTNVKFEILARDVNDKDWFKKTDTNNFFDSRVTSVDVGAYPDQMILKMMFCSKLGVSFPDENGKICHFAEESIKKNQKIDQLFVEEMNQLISDEAVVIPIRHHSDKWLVSQSIDPSSLPSTTIYPQFELIKILR